MICTCNVTNRNGHEIKTKLKYYFELNLNGIQIMCRLIRIYSSFLYNFVYMFMFLVECWRCLPFLYFMCTCILTLHSGCWNQCGCYEPLWLPNMTRNIPLVWLDIRVVYQLQVRSTYVHLGSFFSGVRVAHSLVFCIVFCRSLIVCLFFRFVDR